MRKRTIAAVVLGLTATLAAPAQMASAEEIPTDNLSQVAGISADQRAAISSFESGADVSSLAVKKPTGKVALATGSRRATYYRGSWLMWTRDNVDFGYDWSRVTWTSPYQQAGSVFPNVARNRGISKYYDTATNDRFRALNTIGAGIVTPWGDVTVYTSDFVHRLSVYYNGAWSAWSD